MIARADLPDPADGNQTDESTWLTHSLQSSDWAEGDASSAVTSRFEPPGAHV